MSDSVDYQARRSVGVLTEGNRLGSFPTAGNHSRLPLTSVPLAVWLPFFTAISTAFLAGEPIGVGSADRPEQELTHPAKREHEEMAVKNPVIAGFNPDPSICRKGNVFYCATSSFQWFPGVPIYRSTDLRHWELLTYALKDRSMLAMERIQDGAGIWAPSLTYADGLFWLVYPLANGSRQNAYECDNYLTFAEHPSGPWSPPIYLHSLGNDPALFHDEDGRKYVVATATTHIPGRERHLGIVLQELSMKEGKVVGPRHLIFTGTPAGVPEGAKMYKRHGWYYLMLAEGGTGFKHQVTMARSRNIRGPYEVHPENPILKARTANNPIQRAGHADVVPVNDAIWAMVYLAGRPIEGYCFLGRETFLARGRWDPDDWFRLENPDPSLDVPDFGLPPSPGCSDRTVDDFTSQALNPVWNSLRVPIADQLDLTSRPSWLGLRGTPSSFDSLNRPSIMAQRVRHHVFEAEALLDFVPSGIDQWAGIICYYDHRHWYACCRLLDLDGTPGIMVMGRYDSGYGIRREPFVPFDGKRRLRLGLASDGQRLSFRYAPEGGDWVPIKTSLNALYLSDEFVENREEPDPITTFGFTGAMVGLASYDITGTGPVPFFDSFTYQGRPDAWPKIAQ